jgi:uncharacterized protein (TIGR02444 family)
MPDPATEFWHFSLALYAEKDVASACLALQDGHGIDVNLMLYACWLGLSGRGRLTAAALAAANAAVVPWRCEVIERLRAARRAIKPAAIEGLYAKAKALELEAEHEEQRRLVGLAPEAAPAKPASERLSDALANLALYLGEEAAVAPIRAALEVLV